MFQTKRSHYYPWLICICGLLILVVVNGLTTSSLSVFDEILMKEFHLSRSELKGKESITNLVAATLIILSGMMIDRFRVKRIILFGLVIQIVAFFVYSHITSLGGLYFAHFLLGVAYICAGTVPCIILVSSWFQTHRGLALGITLVGTSLGGSVFPNLLTHFINQHGWRETFTLLSVLPTLMMVVVVLVVRSSPTDLGLKPYGQKITHPTSSLLESGMEFAEAIRTPIFWMICACGFMTFYSVVALVSNLFLHIRSFDYDTTVASSALSLYFLLALTGKFLISSLSDYLNTFKVFTISTVLLTLGAIGFATMDKSLVFVSVGITALSWGGIFTLYNVMIVKTFGLKSAGKINGLISAFESVGSLSGPILTGYIFDQNQSYQPAFLIICVIMFASVGLSLRFKSYVTE